MGLDEAENAIRQALDDLAKQEAGREGIKAAIRDGEHSVTELRKTIESLPGGLDKARTLATMQQTEFNNTVLRQTLRDQDIVGELSRAVLILAGEVALIKDHLGLSA